MTTLDMIVSDSSWQLARETDAALQTAQPASTMLAQPFIAPPRVMKLSEPSSLALVLIGMGTLVAYRGIHKRLTGAIAGVKDSSGSLDNMRAMIQCFPQLAIFTGDDDLLLPLLRSGGAGSITAGANIAPHLLAHIYANWRRPDEAVERYHAMLENLWTGMLLKHPVTEALKEILAAESDNEAWLHMRAPLCRLSPVKRQALLARYREIGFTLITSQRELLDRPARRP